MILCNFTFQCYIMKVVIVTVTGYDSELTCQTTRVLGLVDPRQRILPQTTSTNPSIRISTDIRR